MKLKTILKNTVVHTPTEAEAKELLAILHENEYKWTGADSLIEKTMYYTYKAETCYHICVDKKAVFYSEKSFYESKGYTILTLAEFKERYCEGEKPQPKFRVGDKVRIIQDNSVNPDYVGIVDEIASIGYRIKLKNTDSNWTENALEPYTEPETKEETKELNLCELLQGHEKESIFLTTMGEVLVEKVSEEHLFFRLRANEPGWRLNANGKMSENGVVITYPSRELWEQYPLDPYTAWMKWQEEQRTYEINICIDSCENFMGAVDATTLTFRTPTDRDKCIEDIKAIIEKYSNK